MGGGELQNPRTLSVLVYPDGAKLVEALEPPHFVANFQRRSRRGFFPPSKYRPLPRQAAAVGRMTRPTHRSALRAFGLEGCSGLSPGLPKIVAGGVVRDVAHRNRYHAGAFRIPVNHYLTALGVSGRRPVCGASAAARAVSGTGNGLIGGPCGAAFGVAAGGLVRSRIGVVSRTLAVASSTRMLPIADLCSAPWTSSRNVTSWDNGL